MKLSSFYPVICSDNVTATAGFFQRWFGFSPTFESDWYVSLSTDDNQELVVLDSAHETLPAAHRKRSQGVILNFEVDDVDAVHKRLVVEGGLLPVVELRTEEFGQRHFVVQGPEGLLVDVITVTPPSQEFAAQYTASQGSPA